MNPGEEYSFLGISVCQSVEERVAERKAASRRTARVVAKRIVGVLRMPSCCSSPQTLELADVPDYAPRPAGSYRNGSEIERVDIRQPALPPKHLQRKVVIYSPNASLQPGMSKQGQWRIGFEAVNKWESPLLGWTSTGDSYSHAGESGLYFESRGAAINFAKRYGWSFKVKEAKHM